MGGEIVKTGKVIVNDTENTKEGDSEPNVIKKDKKKRKRRVPPVLPINEDGILSCIVAM